MKYRIAALLNVKNSATLIRHLLRHKFKVYWHNADGSIVVINEENQDNLFFFSDHDYFKVYHNDADEALIGWLLRRVGESPNSILSDEPIKIYPK